LPLARAKILHVTSGAADIHSTSFHPITIFSKQNSDVHFLHCVFYGIIGMTEGSPSKKSIKWVCRPRYASL